MRHALSYAAACSILGFAACNTGPGTAQDVVDAVRKGDVALVSGWLARDPALVHTQVFPQAYERMESRRTYEARYGRSAWEGRYLIHEAAARVDDPVPMLDALAAAGADLSVRLNGRTLLHLAARDGNLPVATWLVQHGADANAVNDCPEACAERGQTPLHDAQSIRADEMSTFLLGHGAQVDAVSANGQGPLHVAADRGILAGGFLLCRHGADPALQDATGKTPYDLARTPSQPRNPNLVRAEDAEALVEWLKPGGGCATVASTARATGTPVSEEDARKVFP